ncbi:anticodon-binding protein [Sphaerisporangium sp. NPDC005289]|uniref:anticodon-binding protein n=1 Tax=Sphaerisporangium sp. NPDC005289 TaxID=3155247 RepID=UPI0033BAA311
MRPIVAALRAVLGTPPVPEGSWEREAVYVSTTALRRAAGRPVPEVAEELAARLRSVPGVRAVQARPNGFLVIELAVPGMIVPEILAEPPPPAPARGGPLTAPWPDRPRGWSNPGFAVRYAYVRAGSVQRWARDLGLGAALWPEPGLAGVPGESQGAPAAFRGESLDDRRDRTVLRVLAELPSRRAGRDSGRPAYLERLAWAYHEAFEHAPAIPMGDQAPTGTHVARLWMARAVRKVLGEELAELGQTPPGKI